MGRGRRIMYAVLSSLEKGWNKQVTIKINHCVLLELEKGIVASVY